MVCEKGNALNDLDQLCVNTLRFLAVDDVEKANSGHPVLPLGAAPMAYALWDRFLHGLTLGVECTTGPLGQGFAMGVGMALAEAQCRWNLCAAVF